MAGLTVLAVAPSVSLHLGGETLGTGARASFADTISGADLAVRTRGGVPPVPGAVFHVAAGPEADRIAPRRPGAARGRGDAPR